ncbi:hypothetical protein PLESTB_001421700 [Pleodorina starrii]|uniref:MI domain-containing protein n=1 Tax=Pleodorina starrii TaxID=330485 RepID=A0A9W6BWC7_9CHLO|nr:hypothetical protein PLESTB_001421700 [Pleodorina starrii]GLC65120.1 hypothetical protein PLESTF_000248700 [Pleodorina starrii]
MYGSDRRGGGRGRSGQRGRSSFNGGGYGRGRGGGRQGRGPALPSALIRELGGDGSSGGGGGGSPARGYRGRGGGGGGSGFPGRTRGRGRDAGGRGGRSFGGSGAAAGSAGGGGGSLKRRAADERTDAPTGDTRSRQDKGVGEQRPAKRRAVSRDADAGGGGGADPRVGGSSGGGLTRTLAAMKQRLQAGSGSGSAPGSGRRSGSGSGSGGSAGTSSKTKFHELLVDGWESRNGREAFMEELRLQARLAKKLGKSKKDALDGMDKLMGYLSAGSGSLLPKYLDPDGRREAADLLAKSGSGSSGGAAGGALLSAAAGVAGGPKAGLKAGSQPASVAAAERKAAELLDRESDEELEFFGINPREGDREEDGDDDEELEEEQRGVYGFGSDSDSEGEEEEGEEEGEEEDEMGVDSGDGAEEEEEEDGEEEEEEDGYDMYGHLMGSDSDIDEGAGEEEDPEDAGAGESEDDGDDAEADDSGNDDEEQEQGTSSEDGEEEDEEEDEGEEDEGEEEEDVRGPRSGTTAAAAAGAGAAAGAAGAGQKYVPPALRAQLAAAAAGAGGGGGGASDADAARVQVERRVTGLINRLAEANLQPISRDVAELYRNQGRRLVSEAVAAQILGAAESGPRASDQFAAVAAAFVSAVAAQADAQDLAAAFLAALAERLEAARNSGDSLAQANLVTLLAYCYSAGLVGPGLCYSLMAALKDRFQEADVSAMVTLLNAVGLQLRNAEPALMKDFVLGVHQRAAQLGKDGQLSRRAQLMLDLIIDIKNNKTSAAGGAAAAAAAAAAPNVVLGGTATRKGKAGGGAAAGGAAGAGRRGGALAVLQPSVAKWLQQIGVEEVCLRGLTWPKLLAPNKKGMWWMPVAGEALDDPLMLAAAGDGGGGSGASGTAAAAGAAAAASNAKLLQLAAAQRMNTDARRAVFVAIMGSEDCAEAHEKLLRLPLKGDQRREIVRVLVDCCLGEKAWNPYYAFLALRLCGGCGGGEGGGGGGGGGSVGRAHRVTMQYCLWDKLKEVESMDVRQLTHLAKLAALLVARFAMSLSWLKVVDWSDQSAKQLLTWRIFLQHLLTSCKTAGDVKQIFARVASQPKTLSVLISGLLLFLRSSFAPWVATKLPPGPDSDELLRRTRTAEKELAAGASAAAAVLI